jgi:2-polyprenyl-3-methyl-5-hydroxy-6-metoxy-1,4-benzoquinol methylase
MNPLNGPERDWRKWGNDNPYFGVLTAERFLNANLTNDSRREFFATGEQHVARIYSVIHSKIQSNFQADRILDYGCGVGRLLIPFAQRARTVVGLDISPGMLSQAKENCEQYGVSRVRLLQAHELDSLEPASFDLVHSFIVFQHIPVSHGERLFRKLIGLISENGVGAVHITFSDVRAAIRRAELAVRVRSRLMHGLLNTVQGRPFSWPRMQMNSYSVNRLFNILMDARCSNLHVELSDHGGFRGAMLYFQRSNRADFL